MPERGENTINPGKNVFAERFAKNAEARIEADKIKNTHDNAVDMVQNNVDFFGRCDEEKQSEIAIRVLDRFGRGYKDVQSMINETNNPNKNQRIAHGDIDSLAESVRITMDMSATGKDLVTDSMTAEEIDENLAKEMKGIGKRIKEKELMDYVKDDLVEINSVIEKDNLFTTQDKIIRGEVYKKWGEKVKTLQESSYVKKYFEVTRSVFEDLGISDVIEKRDEVSVGLGQVAEKISAAAENELSKSVENLKLTVKSMAELMKVQAEMTNRDMLTREDYFNGIKAKAIADSGLDLNDPDNIRMANNLMKQTDNLDLAEVLLEIKTFEKSKKRHERSEWPKDGIDDIYKYLNYIEAGSKSIDDLSTNSDFYRVIYKAQMGGFDEEMVDKVYNGRILTKEDVKTLKEEIAFRMFTYSFDLAASKCKSIEDIMRVVTVMHEGDDGSLDKDWVSNMLKEKGMGLKNIPVDMAWNLRQRGYFRIEEIKSEIESSEDFFNYLMNDKEEMEEFRSELGKKEPEFLKKLLENNSLIGVVELDAEITKDLRYGIEKDVYKNFLQKEKSGSWEGKIIKEYMIWVMKNTRGVSRDEAEKAFELAKRMSRATFMDSKANITFNNDDYSEMLNVKMSRKADGPQHGFEKQGKSKGVGAAETIKFMNSLCCHWMDLSRNEYSLKKYGVREVYSPLLTNEINFDSMTRYNMIYHFGGVVTSQVIPVQEAFLGKINPKDVNTMDYQNKLFARINKTAYDMGKAGIEVIWHEDKNNRNELYNGLLTTRDDIERAFKNIDSKEAKKRVEQERSRVQAEIAEVMRWTWVVNTMFLAGIDNSGWTPAELVNFVETLKYNKLLYNKNGDHGASFISAENLRDAISRTYVHITVGDNYRVKKERAEADKY